MLRPWKSILGNTEEEMGHGTQGEIDELERSS